MKESVTEPVTDPAIQPLAVMDAMKMEHTIAAPSDGVVLALLFAPGDQVAEGDELLTIGQEDAVTTV